MSYRTDDFPSVELVDEELCHALVHQLFDTLVQLFGLHGVGILDVFEHFGRETRQSAEMYHLSFGQCVADLEYAVVRQSHDVAGPGLVYRAFLLCHELCGRRKAQRLVLAYMQVRRVAHELTGTYFAEGDT